MSKETDKSTNEKTQKSDNISVNRADYELLKERYSIAKSVLFSIPFYIVPKNLRDLANKAIKDISE